jgi:hypothetical protein
MSVRTKVDAEFGEQEDEPEIENGPLAFFTTPQIEAEILASAFSQCSLDQFTTTVGEL